MRFFSKERLRLYAPLLVVLLLQGLLIVTLPSRAEDRDRAGSAAQPVADPGAPEVDGTTPAPSADGSATSIEGPGAPGSSPRVSAPGGQDSAACAKPGTAEDRDLGIFCHPAFQGDNGGATAPGVTAETVEVVWFEAEENATLNATLAAQGLATTAEQRQAAIEAFVEWGNADWELYGRRIHVTRIVGKCPTAPQDYDTCTASAQEVVQRHPFAVIWAIPLYADVFDVFVNAGIPTFGGDWFDNSYYADRAPYRWGEFSSGTEIVELAAELYCKNLAGRPADHAGTTIHPTIGGRTTPRHLGMLTSDTREHTLLARHLQSEVSRCTGERDVPTLVASGNDISQGAVILAALTQRLISEGVTTLVCYCEAISTAVLSNYFTSNGYFPEWLIAPAGFMDMDVVGRLADPSQWPHAFGLGQLADTPAQAERPATVAWTRTGHTGLPCGGSGCEHVWLYLSLVGAAVQLAGPHLTASAIERGFMNLQDISPPGSTRPRFRFGPGDYGLISDVRLIYWEPGATSRTDGKRGAYVSLGGGARHYPGELPSDALATIPVHG